MIRGGGDLNLYPVGWENSVLMFNWYFYWFTNKENGQYEYNSIDIKLVPSTRHNLHIRFLFLLFILTTITFSINLQYLTDLFVIFEGIKIDLTPRKNVTPTHK